MKGKIRVMIFMTISIMSINSMLVAQEISCMVLKEEISEDYRGNCKKGLAHGEGVATGIDKYEGQFKKGLPQGKGTYIYSDGAEYKGEWRKGLRYGYGSYSFKIERKDTTIYGYWKDDKFIGKKKNEKEYRVTLRRGVETYTFKKLTEKDNRVEIYFERNTKRFIPTDLLLTKTSGYRTTYGLNVVIEDIKYPFSGSIRYSVLNKFGTNKVNCELDYTIEKPGKWQIVLRN